MQSRKRIEKIGAIIASITALILMIWSFMRKLGYLAALSFLMEFTAIWIIALTSSGRKGSRSRKAMAYIAAVALIPASAALAIFSIAEMGKTVLYDGMDYIPSLMLTALYVISVLPVSLHRRRSLEMLSWAGREISFASLAICLSAIVNLMLNTSINPENGMMTALTGCVMAALILLISADAVLCLVFGFCTTKEGIRMLRKSYKEKRRILHFLFLGKDSVMVLIKIALGLISSSFFMFANALFSCGIGIARYEALKMTGQDRNVQLKMTMKVSAILIFSGICYVCYSIRLFFGGDSVEYGMVMALAIACYTFFDFSMQIMDIARLRKKNSLDAEALRIVSLCSILVCFVLTQIAIMSFSSENDHHISDGIGGVVFGSLVIFVGVVYLIVNHRRTIKDRLVR